MFYNRLLVAILFVFTACSNSPEAINYGRDECDNCRMTIVDAHFAAALLNSHGKTYKFDDVTCMKSFVNEKAKQGDLEYTVYVNQFDGEHILLNAKTSVFLKSENFKSPMNGNYAAFSGRETADRYKTESASGFLKWEDVK
jgi:copper chaperone NosL